MQSSPRQYLSGNVAHLSAEVSEIGMQITWKCSEQPCPCTATLGEGSTILDMEMGWSLSARETSTIETRVIFAIIQTNPALDPCNDDNIYSVDKYAKNMTPFRWCVSS